MLELQDVAFDDHHHQLLHAVSLSAPEGELSSFNAETPLGRTALALITSGRMVPDEGQVLLDGEPQPKRLRRNAALVDSPGITAPEHHMRVRDIVAETLGLQPRTGTLPLRERRISADAWLHDLEAEDLADEYVDTLSPAARIWLLTELAFADPLVHLAVLDSPDRHGLPADELGPLLHGLVSVGSRTLIAVVADPLPQNSPPDQSGQELPS